MAAASIIQPDRTLEERICDLQKCDLSEGVKQIVEEAVQLLGDGRYFEASALVDQAEAASSSAPDGATSDAETLASESESDGSNAAQELAARLVTDIANGLAKVLVGAFQSLERHMSSETKRLVSEFSCRLDRIQSNVECLQPLVQQLDNLVQAGARHGTEIDALRLQFQELSVSSSDRINEICHRIEEQEREISAANSTTSNLAARFEAVAERLERHAGVIRSLHQEHQHRGAALDEVAEVLSRMRTAAEKPQGIAAL
jgi:chromosome segregation ATPase